MTIKTWLKKVFLLGLSLMLVPIIARAALGELTTSAQPGRAQAQAVVQQTARYTLQEFTTPTGLVTREYVNSNGVVFAVSWHGPYKPDLQQLLGKYFSHYRDAPRDDAGSRRARRLEQPTLILQTSGQMRDFHGFAYDPTLLPLGVTADEIQ